MKLVNPACSLSSCRSTIPAGAVFRGRRLAALIGVLIGLMFLQTRYRLTLVVGDSMEPTLRTGDVLLVDITAYRNGKPQRGDVVVCRYRNEQIVKRVVGLAEEQIEITNGKVIVNGCAILEPYLTKCGSRNAGAGRVPDGKIAVVGDNRELLGNSMAPAVVSKASVVGKVTLRIPLIPFNR